MEKDRIALYKEFIKPKITQKLEELRDKDTDFQVIKTSDMTFDEGKDVLLNISKSGEFQNAIEEWKKEFDKKHPTSKQIELEKLLEKAEAQLNSASNQNIEIVFDL